MLSEIVLLMPSKKSDGIVGVVAPSARADAPVRAIAPASMRLIIFFIFFYLSVLVLGLVCHERSRPEDKPYHYRQRNDYKRRNEAGKEERNDLRYVDYGRQVGSRFNSRAERDRGKGGPDG